MVQLTVDQRKKTALLILAFSALGVVCSVYLLDAARVLLVRASSTGVDALIFLGGGVFFALLVLLAWFGAFCVVFRYASSIAGAGPEIEITTETGRLHFSRESVRFTWTTGRVTVLGMKGGIAFLLLFVGFRPFLCPKDNAVGLGQGS